MIFRHSALPTFSPRRAVDAPLRYAEHFRWPCGHAKRAPLLCWSTATPRCGHYKLGTRNGRQQKRGTDCGVLMQQQQQQQHRRARCRPRRRQRSPLLRHTEHNTSASQRNAPENLGNMIAPVRSCWQACNVGMDQPLPQENGIFSCAWTSTRLEGVREMSQ